MKKTIILLIGLMAATSHAVSFTWASADKVSFDGTVLNTTANQATAYLVYLGSDGGWSFGDDITGTLANVTDASVATLKTKTSGSANVKGKFGPTAYGLDGNQGYSYGVVLTYTDSENSVWYNLSSDIFTVDSNLLDNATGVATTFNFSFNKGGEVNQLASAQVGGGWYKVVPVPEPGSAAMALLGLGMLIHRRRKA